MNSRADEQRQGRHRLPDDAAEWASMGGQLPVDAPPPRDPLHDSDAVGLSKFNIGMVPASVTPPKTWRRAAWFTVISSASVLVGLAVAAVELVGPPRPDEPLALPSYPPTAPRLPVLTTTAPPPEAAPEPGVEALADAAPDRAGQAPRDAPATGGAGKAHAGRGAGPGEGGWTGEQRVTAPQAGRASAVPAPPPQVWAPVTTVAGGSAAHEDVLAIASRTEEFYRQVAQSAEAALELVSETVRGVVGALVAERFGEASHVQVTGISVDAVRGLSTSTLLVTNRDGTTSTEHRELLFTVVGEPLISGERPVRAR
ncbi:hypothetical protein [Actinosynnema mirum]|uniref:Uncharacterized protein n=1 Tax=Actinosynnema mirum (strain ATCC 29888 / DSM 43827 / JCM 3225 / NBRC 14064 / NCIMB 13271 / NRRL B-12336 / IMRU 3971 / 101) TaxID=446462 RepID=C6WLT2_ACTMD|nr:hypothetical protein [Actinosynnema mirum]ACU40317.1 hypothetical protein Amir_6517 [Actinosynnema mirum DSM 43827]